MELNTAQVWTVILCLGIGTFLIRFSFLGLVGDRKLPDWLLRHLRYAPVAVLPALFAPLVLWPAANDGQPEPVRIVAAFVTLGVGAATKNVLYAVLAGFTVLVVGLQLFGS